MADRPSLVWDDLRVALAVDRHGSHGGAGRELSVDPTTVGRRIAAMEAAFGARLFDRTPAGLVATREGRALLGHAARAEEAILAAERELGSADARLTGTVRVTAGDGLLHYVVVPALPELRRAHPGVTVELRADTRALDLSRREADVAIRLARPKEPSLVAKRWGALGFGLYASRAYLERRGTPRAASDLSSHELVGFDASLDELPQVKWLRRLVREPRPPGGLGGMAPHREARDASAPRWVVRATTTTAQVVACVEGLGIALLGTVVAAREPRLVPVLPSVQPPPREAWLVVHQDVRKTPRVAAVLEWLASLRLA